MPKETEMPHLDWSPTTYYEAGNPESIGFIREPIVLKSEVGKAATYNLITEVPSEIMQPNLEIVTPEANRGVESESTKDEKHKRELFAPLPYFQVPDKPKGVAEDSGLPSYDYLFADEPTYQLLKPNVDRFGNKERQWLPTDTTRNAAKDRLIKAARQDQGLSEIIRGQAGEFDISDPLKVVDAIRLKPDLRLKVGTHLFGKMNSLANIDGVMPDRIARDTEKRPDKGGYQRAKFTSREYATLLALAMIDGTFDDNAVTSQDSIAKNSRGEIAAGEHQYAAQKVLGINEVI